MSPAAPRNRREFGGRTDSRTARLPARARACVRAGGMIQVVARGKWASPWWLTLLRESRLCGVLARTTSAFPGYIEQRVEAYPRGQFPTHIGRPTLEGGDSSTLRCASGKWLEWWAPSTGGLIGPHTACYTVLHRAGDWLAYRTTDPRRRAALRPRTGFAGNWSEHRPS